MAAGPTYPYVDVKNKFTRVRKKGSQRKVNQLDLSRGNWSIDGIDVTATADELNSGGGGGVSGAANVGGGVEIFRNQTGSTLNFRTAVDGTNSTVVQNADTFQINVTGSGFSHDYDQALWVGLNGNDSNTGESIDVPKLTPQNAIDSFASSTANNVLYIVDGGTYTGDLVLPANCNLRILAKGATLLNTINLITMTSGIVYIDCYRFGTSSTSLFNCTNSTVYLNAPKIFGNITKNLSSFAIFIKTQEVGGDVIISQNGDTQIEFDSISGDVTDTSPGSTSYRTGLFGTVIGGNISSTNTTVFGNVPQVNGTVSGVKQGFFDGTFYGDTRLDGTTFAVGPVNGQPYKVIEWNTAQTVTLDSSNFETYANAFIYYTGTNGYGRFNLIDDSAIPVGFKVSMFQSVNNNQAGAQATTNATLESASTVPDVAYTRRNGSWIHLVKTGNGSPNTWLAYGDLWQANSFASTVNYYFAQSGSNANGDGTIGNPWATPSFAYVTVNGFSPTLRTNLIGLDGGEYNDPFSLTNSLINIIAPQAKFTSTTSDTLDVTAPSGQIQIVLRELSSTFLGGKAINQSPASASQILLNVENLSDGEVHQASTGSLIIQASNIDADMVCTGTGSIDYTAATRTGTDTPGPGTIKGISDEGVSGSFAISQALSVVNNIASTTGDIQAQAGDLIAGNDASPGQVFVYPATTASGKLTVRAVDNTGAFDSIVENQQVSQNTVYQLPSTALVTSTLMNANITTVDPGANVVPFSVTVTAAALAGAASVVLYTASTGARYRIIALDISSGGTNFTVGDRNLDVTDGSVVYSTIPSASLLTLLNGRWGSTAMPLPVAGVAMNTQTAASQNLRVTYSGGTTDYSTGSVDISGWLQRTV